MPDPEVTRSTFRCEVVRAMATGVLETSLTTFAVLIAIDAYQSSDSVKAFILGSHAIGLIASLFPLASPELPDGAPRKALRFG